MLLLRLEIFGVFRGVLSKVQFGIGNGRTKNSAGLQQPKAFAEKMQRALWIVEMFDDVLGINK